MQRISFYTTNMGRLHHLKETFPINIELVTSANAEWIMLDYNSNDGFEEWIRQNQRKNITYARTTNPQYFNRSHSRNIAALLATGDIVCNLDADNILSPEYIYFVQHLPQNVLLKLSRNGPGAGRIALHRSDFLRLGGYDERMKGWGWEDLDLIDRCEATGIRLIEIPEQFIRFIDHSNEERVENHSIKDMRISYDVNEALSKESIKSGILVANHGKKWGKEKLTVNFTQEIETGYGAIPKIVHTFWISGDPLPELQKRCLESWKKHLPDYDIRIWGKDWNYTRWDFSKEAFEQRQYAFVSDVGRLDVLYRFGGIYLDFDVEVKKSFNPFLEKEFFAGCEPHHLVHTATPYIMGCTKENKLVKEFLDFYDDKKFILPDGTFARKENTYYIHDILLRKGNINEDAMCEFMPNHIKLPSWLMGCDSEQSYAIHHCDGHWRKQPTRRSCQDIFDHNYATDIWGIGSGPGSTEAYTVKYRSFLQNYLSKNNIKSVVDIGCGDWQFSKLLDWSGIKYIGCDVSRTIIHENKKKFEGVEFMVLDASEEDIPTADLAIVKDVLQHLSFERVHVILNKLQQFDHVLITQDINGHNNDCVDGDYRALDIALPPFNIKCELVFHFGTGKAGKVTYEIIRNIFDKLKPSFGIDTIRFGPDADCGYIIPNRKYDSIITIGVGWDIGFEQHYSNIYPDTNFVMFDPTICKLPSELKQAKFYKKGLGLGHDTLGELLKIADATGNTLLKIDCEGCEYTANIENEDLSNISAIVIEIHDLHDTTKRDVLNKILDKLNSEFVCINAHANNYAGTFIEHGKSCPAILELTYIKKDEYRPIPNPKIAMNYRNNPHAPEIQFP